jgi:hypothetical protein
MARIPKLPKGGSGEPVLRLVGNAWLVEVIVVCSWDGKLPCRRLNGGASRRRYGAQAAGAAVNLRTLADARPSHRRRAPVALLVPRPHCFSKSLAPKPLWPPRSPRPHR